MSKILPVNYENKFCYNIILENSFDKLIENIMQIKDAKYEKVCIVTDDLVNTHYGKQVKDIFDDKFNQVIIFEIPNGENSKHLGNIEKLYEELIKYRFTRSDLLVALGGGVIGDMTGFTAATYLRGIDFVQIPTTLLSQVDSSIGGKTGVDIHGYKNMVGAFYMPRLVYINTGVLQSLSKEQFSCGMGEVIKYGYIWDRNYYEMLKENHNQIVSLDSNLLEDMIYTSCDIKRQVVEIDPKEHGIRSYLNFGHTIGHAVEKNSNFTLYHGQCVAIGMVAAMYLSILKGWMKEEDMEEMKNLLEAYNLPVSAENMTVEDVFTATKSDKKMVGNKVKFTVLKEIGTADSYMDFTDEELKEAISYILK
ncbi:MAG: 3-dehydroquinate synthase [Lachnospiraceae bacterium]|nr:3-dehydroquinate synthase [Lachnospiraceae bacterium]